MSAFFARENWKKILLNKHPVIYSKVILGARHHPVIYHLRGGV